MTVKRKKEGPGPAKRGPKAAAKPAAKMGRPTVRSPELAARICTLIADGHSLRAIELMDGMPTREMVRAWLADDRHFSGQYTRAREEQADFHAEACIEISDGAAGQDSAGVAAARLRCEQRRWHASKLSPKRYGDSVTHEVNGSLNLLTSRLDAADARVGKK